MPEIQMQTFYAFAFDIEIEQEHFGLCLNSVDTLEISKEKYVKGSFSDKEYEIVFNTGDWKYQSFNNSSYPLIENIWNLKMKPIIASVFSYYENIQFDDNLVDIEIVELTEHFHNGFIRSIEKVIARMKKEKIFHCLKRTDIFSVYFLEFQDDLKDKAVKNRISQYY
ncbi:MAG: DUF4303 domain-containing protein [Bacteroidota bacterium]